MNISKRKEEGMKSLSDYLHNNFSKYFVYELREKYFENCVSLKNGGEVFAIIDAAIDMFENDKANEMGEFPTVKPAKTLNQKS